jgi:hypothetical protein
MRYWNLRLLCSFLICCNFFLTSYYFHFHESILQFLYGCLQSSLRVVFKSSALLVMLYPLTFVSSIEEYAILRFIEDNWSLGRIGDQSFDSKAGSLANMFDFVSRAGHVNCLQREFADPYQVSRSN